MTNHAKVGVTVSWASGLVVIIVLCLAGLPLCPVLFTSLVDHSVATIWTRAFTLAVANSLSMAAIVAVIALAVGLPLGVLSTLYQVRGRGLLIACQVLPLLFPSFLPSIGWSNLAGLSGLRWLVSLDGRWACILVMSGQAIPLVYFATWSACANLTATQIESARLYGGERAVVGYAMRACVPVAIVVALLAGVLSLSDAGAPLIFGVRSAAVEIRTSFSALYDFDLAGRQCLAMTLIVLLLATPLLAGNASRIAAAFLARQLRPLQPTRHPFLSRLTSTSLIGAIVLDTALPLAGIGLPVFSHPMFGRAVVTAQHTLVPTALFAIGAGTVAVVLALTLTIGVRTRPRWRLSAIIILLLYLATPPALAAIGVLRISNHLPPFLDWLVRGRATVPVVLGLRLLPVAAILVMRADASFAPSWHDVAQIHGVPALIFHSRVILPFLAPAKMAAWLLVAVLSMADVTTTHLLQPPGVQSLPVAVFTVMANSPSGLVASLCLTYVALVVLLFIAAMAVARVASGRI